MDQGTAFGGWRCLTNIFYRWWPTIFFAASLLGCGGVAGPASPQPPPSNITVSLSPASASVLLGTVQTFTAVVSNATNGSLNWQVNGISGGNPAIGTISASGVYTSPVELPSAAQIIVQATSLEDSSKSASAVVTVTSDITVSVSPQAVPVELGAARSFAAVVNSAGNPDRAVNWIVSGNGCAATSCGSVDAAGIYTAPQILTAPPDVLVKAVSVADPSKSGAAAITVTSSFTLTHTGFTSVNTGTTANYTATLLAEANSNPSRAISWSVSGSGCTGAACGTISANGLYTAPSLAPSPATVQITATPLADLSKATSLSVTLAPVVSVSVSPASATVQLGGMQAFHAVVTGSQDASVTWDVSGTVGGSATLGTIANSQTDPNNATYTAPQNLPAITPVTIRARSNANPAIAASATVTFTTAINVALTPASSTRAVGHRQAFAVLVNNTANQTVSWQVSGIAGGNNFLGQICVAGSNPCQQISASNGGSVE